MQAARQHTRDRYEDRCEREAKLGQATETLLGKTLRNRSHASMRRDIPRSNAATSGIQPPVIPPKNESVRAPTRHADFRLVAPDARFVWLAGTFNDWNPRAT